MQWSSLRPLLSRTYERSICSRSTWILTSDWISLHGSHLAHGSYVTWCKVSLSGLVKGATCTDFVAKSRTTLYFLHKWTTFRNLQQAALLLACVQTPPLPQKKLGEETLPPIFSEGGGTSIHRLLCCKSCLICGWYNAQHCYWPRLAAMSQDKLQIFDARFIVPLLTGARGKMLHSQTLHVVKARETSPYKMTVRVMLHTNHGTQQCTVS